jgi:N-acetylmuramoyl-L-alanine amidase
MVLDMSAMPDYRVFALDDPYRIVIDLPSFEWRVGSISKPGGSAVNTIRQGALKPGYSRIVIDMDKPVVIKTAFALPSNDAHNKPNRLVVDFATASRTEFLNERAKVRGKLNLENISGSAINTSKAAPPPDAGKSEKVASAAVVPDRKPPATPPAYLTRKPLIVIDPGHGGRDPGAINKSHGIKEKNITLSVSKELKKQLEATGRYQVSLTRYNDKGMRLYDRVDFARNKNADLFISLHADSIGKSSVRGASIYTLSSKASDEQTAKLAAKENSVDLIWGVKVEDSDVEKMLLEMVTTFNQNQSNFFANKLVESLGSGGINLLQKPHRSAGFAVLKAPDIPSVLVEMGFMSNSQEALMLTRPEYRREIARALVQGIDTYFTKINRDQQM